VLAYQFRPLSDVLFQPFVHWLFRLEGSFYFALSAISIGIPGDTDEMRGKIYIYKSKSDWKLHGKPSIRDRLRAVRELPLLLEPDRVERILFLYEESETDLKRTADIVAEFVLFRNGEVFFGVPTFRDKELDALSTEYANSRRHDLGKWLADQCYFFLRDITHRHQHHAPSSDTILILQYRTDDDVEWRRYIIYSLYHYIIREKRFSDIKSLFQSMGVLAYCTSFRSVCEERFGKSLPGLPKFNDETLLQSLRARAEELTADANERTADATLRISRAANWRLFGFALVAAVVAVLVMLVQPQVESGRSQQLKMLSEFATDNLLTIVLALVLVLVFIFGLTQSNWQVRVRIARDLLELSNIKRSAFAALYFTSGVLAIAIASFLGRVDGFDQDEAECKGHERTVVERGLLAS
jgi:hypothetical protein